MAIKAKTWEAALGLAMDIAGLAGIVLIAYGAWMVYRPAGLITGGAELVAVAWLTARKGAG